MATPDLIEEMLQNSVPLTEDYFNRLFETMLAGDLNSSQIAAILALLRTKKLSGEMLAGAAKAMREASSGKPIQAEQRLVDNCGTGGDGSDSFNISTASALVAASYGLQVIKHGNRSVSSKCGSADLLAEIGYPLEKMDANACSALLKNTNFCFLFAPAFHPAMSHIMPVRKALGFPTLFNLLGPLANPLRPDIQLIGVGKPEFTAPMAEALKLMGVKKGLVLHSDDGMDEISPFAPTHGFLVEGEKISPWSFNPETVLGTARGSICGGGPAENAEILKNLLCGSPESTYTDTVSLNCGALLWLAGEAADIPAGYLKSKELLRSGKALRFVDSMLEHARKQVEYS